MPRTSTPPRGQPPLRDARLVAFLMYLTGTCPQDEDGRLAAGFARAAADARSLLRRQPLTTAFDDTRPHRSVAPYVWATVARRQPVLRPLIDQLRSTDLADDAPITVTLEDFRLLLDACVDDALLRGACVMYCLLKDGAR